MKIGSKRLKKREKKEKIKKRAFTGRSVKNRLEKRETTAASGNVPIKSGRMKKNVLILTASTLLFFLTAAGYFTFANVFSSPQKDELVNWMFVTGKSAAEVLNADTYYQAEADNRVSKPLSHSYLYAKYTAEGGKESRLLRLNGLFSPTMILVNGQEVYNNGYGSKEVVGNSYNEVVIPAGEGNSEIEVFLFYPFAFRFSAFLASQQNNSLFSASTFRDGVGLCLCLAAVLVGVVMLVSVFAMMFRGIDVLYLTGLSAVVILVGVSSLIWTISTISDAVASYTAISFSELLSALAVAAALLLIHAMMNKKRRAFSVAAAIIPVFSALYFIPNLTVMRVSGILMGAAAASAGVILFLEMRDIPNLSVRFSSLLQTLAIYVIVIFVFCQTAFAGGFFDFPSGFFAVSLMVFCLFTYFVFGRQIAQKRLESISGPSQRSELFSLFDTVLDIIDPPLGLTSVREYAVEVCERTADFLVKSDLLIAPDDMICCAAMKAEEGFREIYNYLQRSSQGYHYADINEHFNDSSERLQLGSSFVEMKFGRPDAQELIIIFENTFYDSDSDFKEFMKMLYKSASMFLDRMNKNFENKNSAEEQFIAVPGEQIV